jgi:hypothetical protein
LLVHQRTQGGNPAAQNVPKLCHHKLPLLCSQDACSITRAPTSNRSKGQLTAPASARRAAGALPRLLSALSLTDWRCCTKNQKHSEPAFIAQQCTEKCHQPSGS